MMKFVANDFDIRTVAVDLQKLLAGMVNFAIDDSHEVAAETIGISRVGRPHGESPNICVSQA